MYQETDPNFSGDFREWGYQMGQEAFLVVCNFMDKCLPVIDHQGKESTKYSVRSSNFILISYIGELSGYILM